MSTDYRAQIDRLMLDSRELDDGPTKVQLIEEAVRLADTHSDVEAAYKLRKELLGAALSAGDADKLIVAYSWCLAQSDQNPKKFNTTELLWEYRWVVSELPSFPEIKREQIESMYQDMVRRYEAAGASMRSVYLLRRVIAIDMGDRKAAVEANKKWKSAPRDFYSDSYLTELAFNLRYLMFVGKEHLAIEQAEPFYRGGLWSEHHEGGTLALLLLPLMKRGQAKEMLNFLQRSYQMLGKNPRYVEEIADYLLCLVLTENHTRALKMFAQHLPWALANCSAMCRFYYFRASVFLFRQLREHGITHRKLRLPEGFPVPSVKGQYALSDLEAWFTEQALDRATRLDARNGNTYYSKLFAELKRLPKYIIPCPM